ncbi:Peroxisome biosynthesis protein pex1 [Taxawa tesnikishii (nom. ined.)]|nr:Peroxisome biosynthesis protein pex1 [Dothideales sp. JES 119]
MTDETRVSTIKEALHRVFGSASWGARLGGKSLVILDDLDKLCPVETELQIGGENGRSRQVSELVCSVVRQYASRDSGVVLLATAQGKESLNAVVVGGHILRDVVSLKAPNKDGRRQVLKQLIEQKGKGSFGNDRNTSDGSAWMDESGKDDTTTDGGDEGFLLDPSIDLLDIAGQTDGYMPGDLTLLVSRAHSEALVRSVSAPHGFGDGTDSGIILSNRDFAAALKGFTPASLRNVTLQSSTTTFSSIGGLRETRQTLLETLQYPTTYAPIFAHCPLRLRSGLLLYGYPGCGKTLLASAVAGECGLNFISVKGPEILNKYIGASEKSVRDLFERAEAARPCVLFFDEFDSIAPKRGHDSTGVTDRVVNQLLTQMDGAEGLSGVYVLAATSRPDLIDPALLRPGRLDKSLLCDMPSLDDRLDILKAVSSKLRLENSLLHAEGEGSLQEVARQTEGYSGADLQAVMYNAHLEAIHNILGPTDTTYAALAERASIASKLSAIEVARRRAKQQRSQEHNQRDPARDAPTEDTDDRQQEPVIGWQHIRKSLSTTRPSISRQEQRRLQGIYKEFVVGRNGEMPNGQAGNEIGARTSLM